MVLRCRSEIPTFGDCIAPMTKRTGIIKTRFQTDDIEPRIIYISKQIMKINKEEGRSNNKYREIVSECFSSTEKKEEIKIISLDA